MLRTTQTLAISVMIAMVIFFVPAARAQKGKGGAPLPEDIETKKDDDKGKGAPKKDPDPAKKKIEPDDPSKKPPTPPPASGTVPSKANKLELSDDLRELKERLDELGTPKHYVHNAYSFSVFVPANKAGKEWHTTAEQAAKLEFKDDPDYKDVTKFVKDLRGVTFSCYKDGKNFTHVIYHFVDAKGKEQAVGLPTKITPMVTDAVVMNFQVRTNSESIMRAVLSVTGKGGP